MRKRMCTCERMHVCMYVQAYGHVILHMCMKLNRHVAQSYSSVHAHIVHHQALAWMHVLMHRTMD